MAVGLGQRAALVEQARQTIAVGSKSFAAASRLFDRETRERVWLLYAWCRACDDLADAQDMGGTLGDQAGAQGRFALIHQRTAMALAGEATGDPAFDALAVVAAECGITKAHTDDVIAGFALDAAGWRPQSAADMLGYCFHVAGAVGVVMALVMGVAPGDDDTLDRACDLGMAFQLGNIMRDVAEDAAGGRCYLPADWLAAAGMGEGEVLDLPHRPALVGMVQRMGEMAAAYEASAKVGAGRLPFRCRWAVLAAAGIYGGIARGVMRAGDAAWDARVTTSTWAKLGYVAKAGWQALLPAPRGAGPVAMRRGELVAAMARFQGV